MVTELTILDKETIFDTNTRYVIPCYQRAYAWEDKEIEQLIDDIYDIPARENYYIGMLIVSRVKGKSETFEVVDGQQRLTTLYLLFQYLVSEGSLEGRVGKTLTFDCRPNSNYTLFDIQTILKGSIDSNNEEKVEQSILNGIKAIRQKFLSANLDKEKFVSNLEHVILYRIEVPENTDLNRYFEIMNTRGEQLEQHDILKAKLMGYLDNRKEQDFFSRIWNACSDMTGYVQMHFSPKDRNKIFGGEWNKFPCYKWKEYCDCLDMAEKGKESNAMISKIIAPNFEVNNIDGVLNDDIRVRFESIIDFPYFLIHTLRLFTELYIELDKPLGDLIDDKKLITDFNNVINYGTIKKKPIKNDKKRFSQMFIVHLLKTRYLFDKYIIKREYIGENKEGDWSLKELHTSGQGSSKKAYYSNTKLKYKKERENTFKPRNKECLMIQSALRVSYTSPKVMHWITDLLLWLHSHDEDENPKLIDEAEAVAKRATKKNFLEEENYKLGVQTPHVVFNYLDYLLWKENKERYDDFTFEFRNSVEHWYPQNPSDGSFAPWKGKDKDTFGNLCIISRSVNSKFSNRSPESKTKDYKKIVEKGSLKLRIMGEIMQKFSNNDWINGQCQNHEEEMIKILKEACDE